MALKNPYFKDSSLEQNLSESLIIESIQVMGREYFYLPRTVVQLDKILGEDISSRFDAAISIEMYMQDMNGFQGDNELFSKFGLSIDKTYTLIVSQKRFLEDVVGNVSRMDPTHPTRTIKRPVEGDLIYDPLTKHLFEIKNVDIDYEFYQLGKNYMFHLTCESFKYNSEPIATGIADIDAFENMSLNENSDRDLSDEDKLREYGTSYAIDAEAISFNEDDPFGEL
jgi:hypothetical protein